MRYVNRFIILLMLPVLLLCTSENNLQTKDKLKKGKAVPWNQWIANEDRLFSDFMDAIFRNDYSFVNKCIQNGLSCDFTTETGLSPMELALFAGHEKIVTLLKKNGGRIDLSQMAIFGVLHESIPILEQSGFKQGLTSNPLPFALIRGVKDEVINYLLDDYLKKEHTLQQDVECFNSLLSSISGKFYPDQSRIVALAKKLLASGIDTHVSSYTFNFDHIIQFSDLTEDISLYKKFWYDTDMVIKQRQNYRNTLLGKMISLNSFDSLLKKGANPFEKTFIYNSNNNQQYDSRNCAFDNLREYGTSPLDWQKVKMCIKLNPDLAGEKMTQQDRLFVAAVSSDISFIEKAASTQKGIDSIVAAVNSKGTNALTLAASAGDSAMIVFLLGLPFNEKQWETALLHAVKYGSVNGVKVLIENGANPHLPHIFENEGLQSNLLEMFTYDHSTNTKDMAPGIDTIIAEILLSAASNSNSSDLISEETRSVLSIDKFIRNSSCNPELFRFLWRQQPWLVNKKQLFSNSGFFADNNIVFDTAIMNAIDYQGYEKVILDGIIEGYNVTNDYENVTANLSSLIDTLNKAAACGLALDRNLPRNWTGRPGGSESKYQIGFDFKQRKFIPVWNVPSLFSSRAAFIYWDD